MRYQKDYYQILGVRHDATSEEITSAYRQLDIHMPNHLDNNLSPLETARIEAINEAYDVLGDQSKRIAYDSEYFDSPASLQTEGSFYAETANLQEFSAKENPMFLPVYSWLVLFLLMATVCLIITIFLFVKFLPYVDWNMPVDHTPWDLFLVVPLGVLSIGIILFWMQSSKSSEKENQCPKCGKAWAAEKLSERLMGMFKKAIAPPISQYEYRRKISFVTRAKYQIHYKCKYCSYEWLFNKTGKV